MNFDEIEKELDEYINVLDSVADGNDYMLVALYVTDIVKNGSYIIYNRRGNGLVNLAYQKEINEGEFIPGIVSRKKHVVPMIMEVLEG